jgi:hypothetical protein
MSPLWGSVHRAATSPYAALKGRSSANEYKNFRARVKLMP